MMIESHQILLDDFKNGLVLTIVGHSDSSLAVSKDSNLHEAKYQIKEGHTYDFSFNDADYSLCCPYHHAIVKQHKANKSLGTIQPNIYVGTLSLEVFRIDSPDQKSQLQIEVQSVKSSYRTDYQYMLNDIAEKCTEIILQSNSPVSQTLEIEPDIDTQSLYQRFAFIRSMLDSEEFDFSIQKIQTNPSTQWKSQDALVDVRKVKRFNNRQVRSLVSGSNRIALLEAHPLSGRLSSIASKIESAQRLEDFDTNENRFVKHTITTYRQLCEQIAECSKQDSQLYLEAMSLSDKLDHILQSSFFKSIARPQTLNLNSPLLQRKAGYRQQLKLWVKFDLAAKLVWSGGDDVYKAGKKDIATLYEYWLFFELLTVIQKIFAVEASYINELIVPSKNTLNLQLKQGKYTAVNGVYTQGKRNLNVRFNYNKSFKGSSKSSDREKEGSWTTTMRPDYTLSIWPQELADSQAEKEEQIVHIHFDAKYKLANLSAFDIIDDLSQEEIENRKGIYKNADLLKMHAYKDAIRRTSGAYVLYPGTENKIFEGFHEVLPGLGAFPISPRTGINTTRYLEEFLRKVLAHFLNRASQRENIAAKTYDILKDGEGQKMNESLPEYLNGEKLIPDETYVLVGFIKNKKRRDWYLEHSKYNFRMNDEAGSLVFLPEVVNAKYLLLRESGNSEASLIYKLKEGVRVYSKEKLISEGHPEVSKEHYLVYEFDQKDEQLKFFDNMVWDFKELEEYKNVVQNKNIRSAAGIPFIVSLTNLMKVKIMSKS